MPEVPIQIGREHRADQEAEPVGAGARPEGLAAERHPEADADDRARRAEAREEHRLEALVHDLDDDLD